MLYKFSVKAPSYRQKYHDCPSQRFTKPVEMRVLILSPYCFIYISFQTINISATGPPRNGRARRESFNPRDGNRSAIKPRRAKGSPLSVLDSSHPKMIRSTRLGTLSWNIVLSLHPQYTTLNLVQHGHKHSSGGMWLHPKMFHRIYRSQIWHSCKHLWTFLACTQRWCSHCASPTCLC